MNEKEIQSFLASIKLLDFTDEELPAGEDMVKFAEAQINGITSEIVRTKYDIANYISYLRTKDQVAQEFAQGKLRELVTAVKTLKLQLRAAWEFHNELTKKN